MNPEQEIINLKKRMARLERKLLQKELAEPKVQAPKSKAFRRSEAKYRIQKYLMGIQ